MVLTQPFIDAISLVLTQTTRSQNLITLSKYAKANWLFAHFVRSLDLWRKRLCRQYNCHVRMLHWWTNGRSLESKKKTPYSSPWPRIIVFEIIWRAWEVMNASYNGVLRLNSTWSLAILLHRGQFQTYWSVFRVIQVKQNLDFTMDYPLVGNEDV